jgi:hypothetical protein
MAMATKIVATPQNAPQIRELIHAWPELESQVKSLQAQGLFPGIRAMNVTLDDGLTLEEVVNPENGFFGKKDGIQNEGSAATTDTATICASDARATQ